MGGWREWGGERVEVEEEEGREGSGGSDGGRRGGGIGRRRGMTESREEVVVTVFL